MPPKLYAQRGVTLIEVMIVVGLVTLLSAGMFMGLGGLASARLRESSTSVVSAIRIAYNHANATSRPTRLVFDFESRTITIEESPGRMLLKRGERTGGAAAATDLERAVIEESDGILEGPRTARPSFQPVGKILGFEYDEAAKAGHKTLRDGIVFRQIEVAHEEGPVTEDRVYLYFWPGGQTERAAIQIQKSGGESEKDDVITITVAPLTGTTAILGGALDMPRPMSDGEASERADSL